MKRSLAMMIVCLLLTGCTVYRWEIEAANKLCADHNGVDHYYSGWQTLICQDGYVQEVSSRRK